MAKTKTLFETIKGKQEKVQAKIIEKQENLHKGERDLAKKHKELKELLKNKKITTKERRTKFSVMKFEIEQLVLRIDADLTRIADYEDVDGFLENLTLTKEEAKDEPTN